MEAYLDNSATTRCSDDAAKKVLEALTINYGNPSSLHKKGMEAEEYLDESRKAIAKSLGVKDKEIIFTSGGSESNNLAIMGTVKARKRRGNHIITTSVEHASVHNPMKALEEEGYEITYLDTDENGIIDLKQLRSAIQPDTILVSMMHVNNEIGAVEPIEEAGRIIKNVNPECVFHVDAIQSYGKFRIRPHDTNIDLLSVSGHKINGPKGSGFLYVRDGLRLVPIIFGGGQEKGLRSGTQNVPAIAGLGVAAQDADKNLDKNREMLFKLKAAFIDKISALDGITINGLTGEKSAPHIVSVTVSGVRAEVLLHSLEEKNIYVSSGSACSSNKPQVSRTLQAIKVSHEALDSTVRFSFGIYNTMEEIDYAVESLKEILPALRKYTRK